MLKELQAKAGALYKPRGSNQRAARSLSQARDLTKQVREIRVRSRDREALELERRRLEKEAAEPRAETAGLRGRENHLERLISALPMVAKRRRAPATRVGLESRLAGMPASSPLLLAAERIDELLQGLGRFEKNKLDLPGLEGQSAASGEALARLLERLGMSDSTTRRVTDARGGGRRDPSRARASGEPRARRHRGPLRRRQGRRPPPGTGRRRLRRA